MPRGLTLLEVSDLAAAYNGTPALRDVTFTVEQGSRIGVLGPNGGGKTTLFRTLLGELRPAGGTVALAGRCGTVPQTERSRLDYPVSALDVALMGALPRLGWWRRPGRPERRAALEALATVGMEELAQETFGELSGGQRQRVLIARALVQEADLLLLDEPFSNLDDRSSDRLMELIDQLAHEGRAVMVATHDMEQTRAWDRVLCLNMSQVAFGPPGVVLTREVVERTYGGSIIVLPAGSVEEARAEREGSEAPRGVLPAHHHRHEH
jgi:ABC-type Mn2+/Zn2+ transport system ATPase subunit